MAEVRGSVWLDASPESVWPYLVEPDKLIQWLTEMRHVEWLDEGPIGVGSRYYVNKEVRGQVRRYDTQVTRLEENRIYGFVSEASGFSHVDGVWELVPEDSGCRFEMRETITLAKPNPVANWFVKWGASRAIREFQAQLKCLVEDRGIR
jgi:uncharacterized protein YndB with AHSA1/START domain